MLKFISFCFVFASFTSRAQVVTNFSLTNVSSGQYVALDEYASYPGVILIFTSTDCPYDDYYLNRIKGLADTYKSTVPVLLINSNSDETGDNMKKYVEQNNLTVPYLWDLEQKVKSALGANKSPECFLLDRSGGKFNIVYRGAIDDNAQTESSVNHSYLKDAVEKLMSKQKIETKEMRPVGCSIR